MEKKLSRLFDYQKYSPNSRLDSIIQDVESRYSGATIVPLSDDQLDLAAAGIKPDHNTPKKDDQE